MTQTVKHRISPPDAKRNDTASGCDQTNNSLFSSNDDGTMSLPPTLLHLVDQAKDALWALTACIFHPSARVKINGRTCAYTHPGFFYVPLALFV